MSLQVIEGTWEEIERRKAELIGYRLRVTVMPELPLSRKKKEPSKEILAAAKPKKLVGYGAFKGKFGGTEAFIAEKQAEIELEDRNL